jgi:hypothetical protein
MEDMEGRKSAAIPIKVMDFDPFQNPLAAAIGCG